MNPPTTPVDAIPSRDPLASYLGGRRRLRGAIVSGAFGMTLTLFGITATAATGRSLTAYLTAFVYWLSLCGGALAWLLTFHSTHARWPVLGRRLLEAMTQPLWVLAGLFLPLALGLRVLYPHAELQHSHPLWF